jgi:hypothetical protein
MLSRSTFSGGLLVMALTTTASTIPALAQSPAPTVVVSPTDVDPSHPVDFGGFLRERGRIAANQGAKFAIDAYNAYEFCSQEFSPCSSERVNNISSTIVASVMQHLNVHPDDCNNACKLALTCEVTTHSARLSLGHANHALNSSSFDITPEKQNLIMKVLFMLAQEDRCQIDPTTGQLPHLMAQDEDDDDDLELFLAAINVRGNAKSGPEPDFPPPPDDIRPVDNPLDDEPLDPTLDEAPVPDPFDDLPDDEEPVLDEPIPDPVDDIPIDEDPVPQPPTNNDPLPPPPPPQSPENVGEPPVPVEDDEPLPPPQDDYPINEPPPTPEVPPTDHVDSPPMYPPEIPSDPPTEPPVENPISPPVEPPSPPPNVPPVIGPIEPPVVPPIGPPVMPPIGPPVVPPIPNPATPIIHMLESPPKFNVFKNAYEIEKLVPIANEAEAAEIFRQAGRTFSNSRELPFHLLDIFGNAIKTVWRDPRTLKEVAGHVVQQGNHFENVHDSGASHHSPNHDSGHSDHSPDHDSGHSDHSPVNYGPTPAQPEVHQTAYPEPQPEHHEEHHKEDHDEHEDHHKEHHEHHDDEEKDDEKHHTTTSTTKTHHHKTQTPTTFSTSTRTTTSSTYLNTPTATVQAAFTDLPSNCMNIELMDLLDHHDREKCEHYIKHFSHTQAKAWVETMTPHHCIPDIDSRHSADGLELQTECFSYLGYLTHDEQDTWVNGMIPFECPIDHDEKKHMHLDHDTKSFCHDLEHFLKKFSRQDFKPEVVEPEVVEEEESHDDDSSESYITDPYSIDPFTQMDGLTAVGYATLIPGLDSDCVTDATLFDGLDHHTEKNCEHQLEDLSRENKALWSLAILPPGCWMDAERNWAVDPTSPERGIDEKMCEDAIRNMSKDMRKVFVAGVTPTNCPVKHEHMDLDHDTNKWCKEVEKKLEHMAHV